MGGVSAYAVLVSPVIGISAIGLIISSLMTRSVLCSSSSSCFCRRRRRALPSLELLVIADLDLESSWSEEVRTLEISLPAEVTVVCVSLSGVRCAGRHPRLGFEQWWSAVPTADRWRGHARSR